jgi:hypothetical protein
LLNRKHKSISVCFGYRRFLYLNLNIYNIHQGNAGFIQGDLGGKALKLMAEEHLKLTVTGMDKGGDERRQQKWRVNGDLTMNIRHFTENVCVYVHSFARCFKL